MSVSGAKTGARNAQEGGGRCLAGLPASSPCLRLWEGSWDLVLQVRPLWGPIFVISNIILDRSSRSVGTGSLTSPGTLFLQPRETRV